LGKQLKSQDSLESDTNAFDQYNYNKNNKASNHTQFTKEFDLILHFSVKTSMFQVFLLLHSPQLNLISFQIYR